MPGRFGLTIRTAGAGDADGLHELFAGCGVSLSREQIAINLFAMREEAGTALIADEWGPPTGVIALHWMTVLTKPLKAAEVTLLLVDPDRRRRGVARLLLKAGSQAARAAGCGELVVRSGGDLSSLSGFALSTGFSPSGDRFVRSLRKHG